jgi:hypothetical protein
MPSGLENKLQVFCFLPESQTQLSLAVPGKYHLLRDVFRALGASQKQTFSFRQARSG